MIFGRHFLKENNRIFPSQILPLVQNEVNSFNSFLSQVFRHETEFIHTMTITMRIFTRFHLKILHQNWFSNRVG